MRDRSARFVTLGIALLLTIQIAPFAWAAPGDPVAVVVRTGQGFSSIQAALDAASAGDTVTVLMSGEASPAAYAEALTIGTPGVTLCATVALGACAPVSVPARWQASAATIAAPPVPFQNDAVRAASPGSTSFFATTQDPTSTDKLQVSEISALSFAFLLETGSCSSGGVRFQLRLDTTGDATPEHTIFAYPAPGFCALGQWRMVDILAGGTWGLHQVGGPSSGASKAAADALTAGMNVTTINLVYDGAAAGSVAWFDNQRINDAVFREQVDTACLDANMPACPTVVARPATILDSPAGAASTVRIAADGVTVKGFTIRATGVGNAQNVLIDGNGARVLDNAIEGNPLADVQFGVFADASGPAPWVVANNTITRAGHTGVYVSGASPGTIADNVIVQNRDNAVYVEGSSGLVSVERNDLRQAVQANLRVTGARPLVLRDNTLGLAEFTIDFHPSSVQTTDARFNDWGAYSREDIEASMNNPAGRTLDISCYYAVDGAPVCPAVPDFTATPSSTHIRTAVSFVDASTPGGNDVASYLYDFGDGATSSASSPTHAFAHSGVFDVTLTVTDSEGFAASVTKQVSVANAAPVLAAIPAQSGAEGALLAFTVSATDPDTDPLTYSGVALPAGASVHPTTGAFRWTPTYAQAGTYAITVRATDGDLVAEQVVDIEVADTDRAPTLAAIADRAVVELTALTVPLFASDADGDAIVLSTSDLPDWLELTSSGATGAIAGTPPVGVRGAYPITVTATAGSLSASRTFTLTVTPAVALAFAPLGATTFHASPAQVVTVHATITNGGTETDTFALSLTNTKGWASSGPASIELAPGESATVSATLVAPARSERTTIAWKATSTTNPSVSKSVQFSADTPLAISFVLTGDASPVGGAPAKVTATWLDGSPAQNVRVTASQTSDLLGAGSETVTGFTDATGAFLFTFDDVSAGLPGSHTVVVVLSTPLLPSLVTSYDVGGLP